MGHAARQPAAARLGAVGRVLLHHRTAAVHAAGADRRAERGHVPRRGGDDLHPGAAAGGDAGPGPGVRPPGGAAGADRRRHHARPPARVRGLRPAADRRAHRHLGPAPGDLAGAGPRPARVAAGRGDRDPADLGRDRRHAGARGRRAAARAGLRAARHPGPVQRSRQPRQSHRPQQSRHARTPRAEHPPVRARPRRGRGGLGRRLPAPGPADPRAGRLHAARGHVHRRAGRQVGRPGWPGPGTRCCCCSAPTTPGCPGHDRDIALLHLAGVALVARRAGPGGLALLHHGDAGRPGTGRPPSRSTWCCT